MGTGKHWVGRFQLSRDSRYLYRYDRYHGTDDVVTVPETVAIIGGNAMTGCRARQIILPENLKVIETWAFAGACITELVIPKSVKRIDYLCLFQSQVQKLTILGKPKIAGSVRVSEPP